MHLAHDRCQKSGELLKQLRHDLPPQTSKENTMFHRILVAIDGSPDASQALTQAIDLAKTENAQLTLITGTARLPTAAYLAPETPIRLLMDDARTQAEAVLRAAVVRVPTGLSVATVLTEQPIRTALIHQIQVGEHDLVLIGSRGRGAVRASLLGSVSHYVLNHSPTPVLIVHAQRPQDAGSANGGQLPRSGLRAASNDGHLRRAGVT
jgi:nucleotide-binding universal stress UspA family protein